jgi:hypothetical protein
MITGIIDVSRSASSFSMSDQCEPASLRWLSAFIQDLPRNETSRTDLNGHHFRHAGKQSDALIKCDMTRTMEPTASLLTIDPRGGSPTVVLNDSRIGRSLWWAPDGRILFAYREDPAGKQNNFGVYSIRIDERTGKAAGPPQPITQGEGSIDGLSTTADGKRLVLWRTNAPAEAFIAKRDARNRQWKEPRRLTLDSNENIADAWTLDSKAVLFVSNRNGTWKLFKQNIDETLPVVLVEGPGISLPRLNPDGTQVLYLSAPGPADVSFPASLMSKPLAGGPPHLVLQEKGIINFECAQAPSKLCIFSNLIGNDLIFRSFDLERGAGREVMRIRTATQTGLFPRTGRSLRFSSTGIAFGSSLRKQP